jgi:hypothetical protein
LVVKEADAVLGDHDLERLVCFRVPCYPSAMMDPSGRDARAAAAQEQSQMMEADWENGRFGAFGVLRMTVPEGRVTVSPEAAGCLH